MRCLDRLSRGSATTCLDDQPSEQQARQGPATGSLKSSFAGRFTVGYLLDLLLSRFQPPTEEIRARESPRSHQHSLSRSRRRLALRRHSGLLPSSLTWNPSGEEREALGGTTRTLRGSMNLFAVETYTRTQQFHQAHSLDPAGHNRVDDCVAASCPGFHKHGDWM